MEKSLKLPVEMIISTTDFNEIMNMANILGLSPVDESNPSLYGKHTFGLEFFIHPDSFNKDLTEEYFLNRIKVINSVGRPVWAYFWENAKKCIPLSYRNHRLVFGDIFKNKNGKKFLLVFDFINQWKFSFESIEELARLPNSNAMFVCLLKENF